MKPAINICVARNGYIVATEISSCGSKADEFVFESFESLVKWLKQNLATPRTDAEAGVRVR